MQEFILKIIGDWGYLGVFLMIFLENIFPPIPSEVILTFGGFMTTQTNMNAWIVILAATVGSVAGAVALYLIGRCLSTERLERLFGGKLGRLLRLKPEDVSMAGRWFVKHGKKTVFLCRFVPIVRSLISIPAGTAKMRLFSFLPLTVLGTFIWNTALVFLGRLAGSAWDTIAQYFDTYSLIALVVLGIAACVVGLVFIKRRFLEPRIHLNSQKSEEENETKTEIS